jgi:hypothetical protein
MHGLDKVYQPMRGLNRQAAEAMNIGGMNKGLPGHDTSV